MNMKRIFVAFFAVAFFTSLCFAQEAKAPINQTATPIPQAAPKPDETQTFTGRIDSLSSSTMSFSNVSIMPFVGFSKGKREIKEKKSVKKEKDGGKKPKNMTVVDGKGQKLRFKVKYDIPITDKNEKAVDLSQIEKGDRVTVTYLTNTKKGTLDATYIKLIARKNIMLKIMDNVL